MAERSKKSGIFKRIWIYLALLGPGLITASAGNDAPGIATYSMAGSFYGYRFLWIIIFVLIGSAFTQEMAARLGAVTGKGTADLIREHFGVKVTFFAMICLLVANIGTTIAEFAGIAAGAELLGLSRYVAVPIFTILIGVLVLRGSYKRVEKFLLVLCLSALSYVISVFIIKPDPVDIFQSAITPPAVINTEFILSVLATIGTTITPWGIFYLQASVVDRGVDIKKYPLTRVDVVFGTIWGNVISAFIIIVTAATLFYAGIRVQEAEQAALALAPLAGAGAKYLFTAGLMGASILAAMVLPLSTVYAITEAFGWERGLDQRRRDAPVFYGLYVAVIAFSALFVLIPNLPLFEIMWLSQSVNAILLPVLLVLVLKLANNREIMGAYVNKHFQNWFAIALTGMITTITLALFILPLLNR